MWQIFSVQRQIAIAMLLIGVVQSTAWGQVDHLPVSMHGKSSPNRINLGVVYTGAIVEASVRLYVEGHNPEEKQVKVVLPAFVRLRKKHLDTARVGQNRYVACDLFISLNTSNEGDFNAPVRVQIGDQEFKIPVTVSIAPSVADATRVLVIGSPYTWWTTDDPANFAPWLALVRAGNLDCSYLELEHYRPVLKEIDLSKYDVVVVGLSPMIRDTDIEKLRPYLAKGGRVIVAANQFMMGSVDRANQLIVPYGLRMSNTEPRRTELVEILAEDISEHPFTRGVQKLKFHRPSPVAVTDKSKGKILAKAPPELGEGIIAVARVGDGEMIAVGISLWWYCIANPMEKDSDNAVLLKNLLMRPRK